MRPSTKKVIEILKQKTGKDTLMLDVACGTGKETLLIRKQIPNLSIHAFDIEKSNKFAEDVVFKQGGLDDISNMFGDQKYDIILCQHIFEHVVYPAPYVANLKNLLKEDGLLIIESPNWTRLFIPFHKIFFWNDPSHVRPYTKISYRKLCKEAGLYPVKIFSKSSSGFVYGLKILFKSKNPFVFIKRLFALFIDPILFDVIILIGRAK